MSLRSQLNLQSCGTSKPTQPGKPVNPAAPTELKPQTTGQAVDGNADAAGARYSW